MPFIYLKTSTGTQGFVLPRHITRDIRFQDGDNINFELWRNKDINNIKTTTIDLTYDNNGKVKNNGIYPSPTDIQGWKFKFKEWGIPEVWKTDSNNIQVPDLTDNVVKEWFDTTSHPDNFLAMYGILPDSPLCISFVNGTYNSGSLVLDKESFNNLLGGSTADSEGGWIAYMKGLGTNDLDRYSNFITSSYNYKDKPIVPENKCAIGSPSQWGSAIGSGIGIALMGAFPGIGIPAAILFGIAGIGVGILQSPILKTC
jgi:hypothetical protein